MTEANALNVTSLTWKRVYDFASEYNLHDLSPANVA